MQYQEHQMNLYAYNIIFISNVLTNQHAYLNDEIAYNPINN